MTATANVLRPLDADPPRWIDQGSQVVKDIERLESETGFSSTLGILVSANNVLDQDVVDLVDNFTIAAEQRPGVVSSSSLVATMSKIIRIPGATVIEPTTDDVAAAVETLDEADTLQNIERVLINDDATSTQINRLAPASLEDRAGLVGELEDDLAARIDALDLAPDSILLVELPTGQAAVRATPAGLATVGIGLLDNLSANRAALTYLAPASPGCSSCSASAAPGGRFSRSSPCCSRSACRR
ncbi:MAG: hypothetical protein ABIP17_11925 [Ilumatobacteraceae bacterium]